MSEFKDRFLDSLDSQLMSSSYLVLACVFYSGSWRVGKACKEAIIFML